MDKRAILVVGVESSGGRLWTEHVVRCGAFGDSGHDQRLDQSFANAGPLIVWRRSEPHFGTFQPIEEMIARLNEAEYFDVSIYWCKRDLLCTLRSQVANGHAATEDEARRRTDRGLAIIGDFIEKTNYPNLIVQYEGLADMRYRTSLLSAFSLSPQRELPEIYRGNDKYLS